MKLLTKDLLRRLPKLGETSDQEDPILQAKFFYPDFDWTWYPTEYDGEDTFFGLVDGYEREFGYFSLSELQKNHGKLGCKIERVIYWKPIPVSELHAK